MKLQVCRSRFLAVSVAGTVLPTLSALVIAFPNKVMACDPAHNVRMFQIGMVCLDAWESCVLEAANIADGMRKPQTGN